MQTDFSAIYLMPDLDDKSGSRKWVEKVTLIQLKKTKSMKCHKFQGALDDTGKLSYCFQYLT